MMDYSTLSIKELRDIVKERGIKGVSALRKGPLAEFLTEYDKKNGQPQVENKTESAPAPEPVAPAAPVENMVHQRTEPRPSYQRSYNNGYTNNNNNYYNKR